VHFGSAIASGSEAGSKVSAGEIAEAQWAARDRHLERFRVPPCAAK